MERTKKAKINLKSYSLEALRELNNEVIQMIKYKRNLKALEISNELEVGQEMYYTGKGKDYNVKFRITKINRTKVLAHRVGKTFPTYSIPMTMLSKTKV